MQTWIPHLTQGDPIVEGLFNQIVNSDKGVFVGSAPVSLPADLEQQIVNSSLLLAKLFQQLGYVGRCSYDLILIGETVDNCRFEFIECNARWGGTSTPMTLMNRLGIALNGKSWAVRQVAVRGLDQVNFQWLVRSLSDRLYNHDSQRGEFILFNPARLRANSAIEAIAVSSSTDAAGKLLEFSLPQLLTQRLESVANSACHGPAPNNQSAALQFKRFV